MVTHGPINLILEKAEWKTSYSTPKELEKNGIYTYDRERKFDMHRIKKIFSKSREQAKKEVADMLKKRWYL